MRSSAVTTGDNLESPPPDAALTPPAVVQGSKSYMDVSISANRTSSKAKSERKPEGDEEEDKGGSAKPPGGTEGKESINRSSACKTLAASSLGRVSLGCGEGAGEVETVEVLAAVVRVGAGSSSMSLTED